MRPSPEEAGPPASSDHGRRVAGSRLVLAVFGVAVAIAGLIILLAVVLDTPTDPDVACQQTPLPCDTMRDYAAAWNDRDAERMRPLLTDRGLRTVLEVASEEELAQNLDALPGGDIIEELRITSVTVDGDTAEVRIEFSRLNQAFDQAYQLVQSDGRWLIDG